jgi:hypothetical protein
MRSKTRQTWSFSLSEIQRNWTPESAHATSIIIDVISSNKNHKQRKKKKQIQMQQKKILIQKKNVFISKVFLLETKSEIIR